MKTVHCGHTWGVLSRLFNILALSGQSYNNTRVQLSHRILYFNDTVTKSDHVASNEWLIMEKKLQKMWQKAVLS